MQAVRIKSQEGYFDYKSKNAEMAKTIWLKEKQLSDKNRDKPFTVRGFSYPAETMVDFMVDYQYSDGQSVNWRERMICPVTGLNNRLRGSIHLVDFELGMRPYHSIYIAEQVTPLYSFLKNKFPLLIGSEYLGESVPAGYINEQKLRHESATNLSFEDDSLDCYLSFECFEHIPHYRKAFSEAARVLKKGGKFMWSVPFADNVYENIMRAFIDENGKICHILEPEYHGDPVAEGGILCFTHFGWQMLGQVKNSGFSAAYAFLYRSEIFGYLGGEQMLFIAEK